MAEYDEIKAEETDDAVRIQQKEQEAVLAPALVHSPEGHEGGEGIGAWIARERGGGGGGGDDGGEGGEGMAAAVADVEKGGGDDGDGGMAARKSGAGNKDGEGARSVVSSAVAGASASIGLATESSGTMDWGLGKLGIGSSGGGAKSSGGGGAGGGGAGGGGE